MSRVNKVSPIVARAMARIRANRDAGTATPDELKWLAMRESNSQQSEESNSSNATHSEPPPLFVSPPQGETVESEELPPDKGKEELNSRFHRQQSATDDGEKELGNDANASESASVNPQVGSSLGREFGNYVKKASDDIRSMGGFGIPDELITELIAPCAERAFTRALESLGPSSGENLDAAVTLGAAAHSIVYRSILRKRKAKRDDGNGNPIPAEKATASTQKPNGKSKSIVTLYPRDTSFDGAEE